MKYESQVFELFDCACVYTFLIKFISDSLVFISV